MRVAFLNQFYVPDLSPTAHLCASLAEHRAARGDEVTVITSRSGYVAPAGKPSDDRGVRVRRIWSSNFGSRSRLGRAIDWGTFYLNALLHVLFLARQDVIVSLTTPPFIALAGVLHKMLHPATRLVLWNMDCYPEALERTGMIAADGAIAQIMRGINRAIFQRIDRLVALDHAMADLLLSQYEPTNRSIPCDVIPNWERRELFENEGGQKARRQKKARSEESATTAAHESSSPSCLRASVPSCLLPPSSLPFTVLYLGNAGYGHEFHTVLRAAELLRDDPVRFQFIGGGAKRAWLAEEQRRRKLANVAFADYVPKEQTPQVMRTAGCALITLESQMLGVMSPSKLHSNLAMGLPILYVGPEGGNVDEAIRRFGCGVSLRPGHAEAMAQFVRSLIADPSRLADLRRRARAAFEQAYCDARTLPLFDRVFESLQPGPTAR